MVVSSNNGKTPLNVRGNKLSTMKPELYRGGVGRHFDVQVGGVLTLEFLRLTNAKHPGQTNGVGLTNVDGGSILISGGGYGLFTSITWSGNEASDGGAVAVKGIPSVSSGPSVFIRCEFFGNKASPGGGGALLLFSKTQAIVVDSNFANNQIISPYGQFGRDIFLLDNVTLYLLSTEKAFSTPDIVDYVSKQRKYFSVVNE